MFVCWSSNRYTTEHVKFSRKVFLFVATIKCFVIRCFLGFQVLACTSIMMKFTRSHHICRTICKETNNKNWAATYNRIIIGIRLKNTSITSGTLKDLYVTLLINNILEVYAILFKMQLCKFAEWLDSNRQLANYCRQRVQ